MLNFSFIKLKIKVKVNGRVNASTRSVTGDIDDIYLQYREVFDRRTHLAYNNNKNINDEL